MVVSAEFPRWRRRATSNTVGTRFNRPLRQRTHTTVFESSWTGLGGFFPGGGLLQEGTDMLGTPGTIFPWYEYLQSCPPSNSRCNPPKTRINNLPTNPGDRIGTYTYYDRPSGRTTFQVCNGQYCATIVAYLDSSYYDGRTADYVDERPDW